MNNLYNQKVISANDVFNDYFLEAKTLYLYHFNTLPSIRFIDHVDGEKAFAAISDTLAGLVQETHCSQWYKREKKRFQFNKTIMVLNNNCIIEFDEDYCEILHDGRQPEQLEQITGIVLPFRQRRRRQPLEINLIVQARSRLELKAMEIKRTRLDLDLYYNDDFKAIDALVQNRLKKNRDKGIVLLHGLPGTGKTSYLRYLVGRIKKRVLFLSPSVAGDLMNPQFIELLAEYPDTVLVIEDAENIIMDRRLGSNASVSNLLNISDGLLADFLNVQIICTFNSALSSVDQALLRKGRLIARYEFGKLGVGKAQRLSNHFGFDKVITEPMTIAELANPDAPEQQVQPTAGIGFRNAALIRS